MFTRTRAGTLIGEEIADIIVALGAIISGWDMMNQVAAKSDVSLAGAALVFIGVWLAVDWMVENTFNAFGGACDPQPNWVTTPLTVTSYLLTGKQRRSLLRKRLEEPNSFGYAWLSAQQNSRGKAASLL